MGRIGTVSGCWFGSYKELDDLFVNNLGTRDVLIVGGNFGICEVNWDVSSTSKMLCTTLWAGTIPFLYLPCPTCQAFPTPPALTRQAPSR